ncbi:MAG: hypothetical protein ACHREM_32325, partial [Polyangiales bacterium]
HGRPPRNHGAIESDDRRTRVAYIPDKHDTLVVDRRTGRLAVNAQYPREHEFYRSAIGRVFWDDEEHFVAAPVFTGCPIQVEGCGALGTHGVPGVHHVALRELRVESKDIDRVVITTKGNDLWPTLATAAGRKILDLGEIVFFKLAIALTGRSRPVLVEVEVPNRVSYDRRVGDEIVREYLLAAGFMLLSANRASRTGVA